MIRILHVVHGMDCGGTENIIMNLYRNIDRSKIQFDFLVHTQKHCFFDDEIEKLGGQIYRVPYYNILNLFKYQKALKRLFVSHKEWRAVHGHLGSCACIYLRIAKQFGIYTIAHSHNVNNSHFSIKELLYRFHALQTRGVADYYMGCSYEAGIERYGRKITEGGCFCVLHNGIKVNEYIFHKPTRDKIQKELGIDDNRFVIGNVGRFSLQKNHMFALDVFTCLRKISDKYMLVLVGDGELKNKIVAKATQLGILNAIVFTGIRKDVPQIMNAFDMFLFPSFYEGLGIALIEAQASGLPCIVNKDGIMPAAVISDLVELKSLEDGAYEWAEYIDKIRQKGIVRKDMSITVKDAGFDVIDVAKWLENFYLSI